MVKIKSKSEPWNVYHNGNEVEEYLKEHILSDEHIIDDDNEIYVRKSNGNILPLSHPDLSTQPSILHERFGTYRIYEVLIPVYGNEVTSLGNNQIPASAVIISAFAFNKDMQSSVTTKRVSDGWDFNVIGGFVPDFFLVKYYDNEKKDGYGSGEYGYSELIGFAYWRYNSNGVTYLTNKNGNILVFRINGSGYAVCIENNHPKTIVISQWIEAVAGEWGSEEIEITAGNSEHFVFSIAQGVSYEVYSGGSIYPEPKSY